MELFLEYCKADLIDPALVSFVAVSYHQRCDRRLADRQAEPETPSSEPYERRYQLDAPILSARVDVKPLAPAVVSGTVPVVEADPVAVVETISMDVDSASEVPKQEIIKSHEEVNGITQSVEEDDLFGENTTAKPALAMSPPRY